MAVRETQSPRPIFIYLVSVTALLVAGWHLWAGDRPGGYHAALAGAVNTAVTKLDPTGHIVRVQSDGRYLTYDVDQDGAMYSFSVDASAATGNLVVLCALYLAGLALRNPRSRNSALGIHFIGSLAAIFLIHVITLTTLGFEGLMSNQVIMREGGFSPRQLAWIPRYNLFYQEIGKYLIVVVLWVPWAISVLRETRLDGPRLSIPRTRVPGA